VKSGLAELTAVLAVARQRNFRAAAADLGMSRSALSHAVSALEQRIGVRLFNRTTRSVSLTEAGEQFVASVSPALKQIEDAVITAASRQATPSGALRINASVTAALQMWPIFEEYMRRYPAVTVDVATDGRFVDIVLKGFDAGVRIAESVPKDMIAIPIGPQQSFAVVGSADYFRKYPKPKSPADLKGHRCIRMRLPNGSIGRWEFERRGERFLVDVDGTLTLDEPALLHKAVLAGLGLAYLNLWRVHPDIKESRLFRVLDEWTPPFEGLCLYYPGRRHVPAPLRALIDLVKEIRSGKLREE
jgi:DNA-binding transcriptional LysR family regulator